MSLKGELYFSVINYIKDPDIQEFVNHALDRADSRFWKAPASSTGKYHPPEDNGEGGLVRHILKDVAITYELARFFSVDNHSRDIVMAGGFLHDVVKNGVPWGERTDYTHGLLGYNYLGKLKLKQPDKIRIMDCVRYHMGQWVKPEETELNGALEPQRSLLDICNKEKLIAQLADYFASRECASFLPGVNLTKKQIENYGYDFLERKVPFLKNSFFYYNIEKYVRKMKNFFKTILKNNIK